MPGCVFCKIVAGTLPCLKIIEDADSLAFLDVAPLAEGHTLLIPKAHYATLDQVPRDLLSRLSAHLPDLVAAVMKATSTEGANVLQNNGAVAGQAVDHVHFHVIPRMSGDSLGYRWPAGAYPEGRDKAVHAQILQALA